MADYTKAVDFAAKDALAAGNPLKIVKGEEIVDEFNAIEDSILTKADIHNETHTGTTNFTTVNVSGTLTAGLITGGTY
jgi:hypothetical protein